MKNKMKTLKHLLMAAACSMLLTGCGSDDEPQRVKYESVDLGLSVKWGTTNIGALQPHDYGQLIGWADSTGSHRTQDKILISFNNGITNCQWGSQYYGGMNPRSDISGTEYDSATYMWNTQWRTPTRAEWNELIERCTWTYETIEGRPVARATGPNGRSIVLPLSGIRTFEEITQIDYRNYLGYYWTSTLVPQSQPAGLGYQSNVACAAWCAVINAEGSKPELTGNIRSWGMTIRPVARN